MVSVRDGSPGQRSRSAGTRRRTSTALAALIFHALLASGSTLAAQEPPPYVVRTASDDVPAASREAVLRHLPRALERIAPQFPGTPNAPFTVVLHRNEASLDADSGRALHPGTPGFALLDRDEIHLLLDRIKAQPPDDLPTVLAHELTHILLDQWAGPTAAGVPRWLHEGLAQSLSGDLYLSAREVDLVLPAKFGRLYRLADLTRDFPDDDYGRRLAYAESFSFVEWLIRSRGMNVIREGIRFATEKDGFVGGYARATRETILGEYERWYSWLRDESGAPWRFILENFFSYLMIGALVLAVLAGMRIWRRDLRARQKLEREDAFERGEDAAEPPPDDPS